MAKNQLKYTPRAFKQDASNAMKGDIVRGLIELITNADDAYGDAPQGKIRIEAEHRRQAPWRLVVKDRAKGMRKSWMEQALGDIGTRTSGFEHGEKVRGNLGRGAKDLAAFGPTRFESICDDYYSCMTIEEDGSFDDPVERKSSQEDRERLGIPRGNGTVVTVTVDSRFRCPRHTTLVENLSKHYQLRTIVQRREVSLTDLNDGKVDRIQYPEPSLEPVLERQVPIAGYGEADVTVKVSRAPERYDNPASNPYRPEGLIIKGERAIYENTLFSLEAKPHAHWFTGTISCEYIDRLARDFDDRVARGAAPLDENPMPIISRSRDGLEREHPFYKELVKAVEPILAELVREEEAKANEHQAKESVRLRSALDRLGRDLGSLVDADLRELEEEGLAGGTGRSGGEPLRIIPRDAVVYMGEDKTISVVADRALEAHTFEVELDPEGVVQVLEDYQGALEDHPDREEHLIGRIHVRPLMEDDETHLFVTCGEAQAVCSIKVRPEREDAESQTPAGLEFERYRYQLRHRKRRALRLRASPECVISAGTTSVRVESSDPGVVILGGTVDLSFQEGEACYVGTVTVDPRTLGARGKLTATLGEARATCSVVVAQHEDVGPGLEIKVVDEVQGRYRAYVDRSNGRPEIRILGRHPAIKRYLGPGPTFPYQDSPVARTVMAEIVAGEAARMVLERKFPKAGELDGPAFYADHLEYLQKYLPKCHEMLVDFET